MLIKQLNRSDPDKVFIAVENQEGAALNRGEVVEWDTTNTLGVSVEELDANESPLVAGIVEDTTIADQAYGLVQVWGYHDAVLTSTTVTVGAAVSATVESSVGKVDDFASALTTSTNAASLAVVGVALTANDTNSAGVFLRLM